MKWFLLISSISIITWADNLTLDFNSEIEQTINDQYSEHQKTLALTAATQGAFEFENRFRQPSPRARLVSQQGSLVVKPMPMVGKSKNKMAKSGKNNQTPESSAVPAETNAWVWTPIENVVSFDALFRNMSLRLLK